MNSVNEEKILNNKISVVQRQTDYNKSQALDKLKENNYDVFQTIRDYMGPKYVPPEKNKTVNQMIYCEIRGMMDDAATRYRYKKELAEYQEKVAEFVSKLSDEDRDKLTNQLKG